MGKKYSTSLWLDEDDVYRLALIAEDLGYNSLSEFMRDIIREIITTYEILQYHAELKNKKHAKRKILLNTVFAKIKSKLF